MNNDRGSHPNATDIHQGLDRSGADRLLGEVAEEFFSRLSRGERPQVEEYADRHPEIAQLIRDTFAAAQLIDHSVADSSAGGMAQGQSHESVGDFRIIREIGRGGMGVVYEAEQLSLGRSVALKVLPYAAMMDQKAITRFKNEARAAATLDHPHIVPVHAVGNERGIYYYAMSLVNGLTLAELIVHLRESLGDTQRLNEPLSIDDVVGRDLASGDDCSASHLDPTIDSVQPTRDVGGEPTNLADETYRDVEAAVSTHQSRFDRKFLHSAARLGAQAAEALEHAHQHGIVHRDIKPGNLMIDVDTKLWITDFGLARIESDAGVTMTGDLVGTLRYMAPEQALAKRVVVDHRADIYALGASLYELLALRPAFDGPDQASLLKQIAFEEPKQLRQLNRTVPEDLQTIIHTALSKNPDERYQSAQAMADDLRAFSADEPIKARPLSIAQRTARWAAKRKGLVAAATGVMMMAIIGLSISNAMIARQRNVAQDAQRSERDERLEADRQRERADGNAKRARETVDTFLTKVSQDMLLNAPSAGPLRHELLKLALNFYQKSIAQHPGDAGMRRELADTHVHVGDIVRQIGSQDAAIEAYQRAIEIRKQVANESDDMESDLALAEAYRTIAAQYYRMNESNSERESLNHAMDVLASFGDDENAPDQVILSRVRILRVIGGRDPANHLANARRALRLLQSVTSRIENADKELAECETQIGTAYFQAADYSLDTSEKERCYRQALEHYEQVAQIYKRRVTVAPTIENRSDLASAYLNHGAAHGELAQLLLRADETREEGIRIEEAKLKIETNAIELIEALANENPMVVDFRNMLAALCNNIAESHMRIAVATRAYDRLEEAMRFALRAGEVLRRIQSDFPMYSTAVPQGESGNKCIRIARMALQSADFSDDRKRQFFEVAMAPILQMDDRLRNPIDRINCAKMALSGTLIPDLKAVERADFLEPVIDLLLEVSVDEREASELGMLGQMLYQVGRYEESRHTLEECIKLHGEIGPTVNKGFRWWYIAMLKARSGESDEARQLWLGLSAEAKTLGKPSLKIRREVGELIGMNDDALEGTDSQALDRMMAAGISYWRGFFQLGHRIQQSGGGQDSERAFAAAAERLQQVPEEKRTIAEWGFLGQTLYESGQYAEAHRALESRFAARPETDPTIYGGARWWYRAMLLARSGEYAKARDYYNVLTSELATHPAPASGEQIRKQLATLLGITDPPPYSLEGIAASSVSAGQNREANSAQISDASFDPIVAKPEYKPESGPVVRIDDGHENFHTIEGRFAGFAKLVRRDGYQVDRQRGQITVEALTGVDVLVIANARRAANDVGDFSAFDTDEIEQLFEWVSAGGSLLLIADHAPFGSASMDLANRFGIEMTNSFAAEPGKRPPMIFHRNVGLASHPITDGRSDAERVDRVATFTGQAFQIAGEAEPLLQFGEDTTMVVMKPGTRNQVVDRRTATGFLQGAVLDVGKGRVAVFGEASMFSAQVIGPERRAMGMNSPLAPDNQQFLLNMMHWLTHRL